MNSYLFLITVIDNISGGFTSYNITVKSASYEKAFQDAVIQGLKDAENAKHFNLCSVEYRPGY